MLEEVRSYAQELLRLSERRQVVLNDMVALAQPLPKHDILRSIPDIAETTAITIIGELGNIRCFQSTNSCHIADFYEKRKRQYLQQILMQFLQYIVSFRQCFTSST
jgi:hypothetical protein